MVGDKLINFKFIDELIVSPLYLDFEFHLFQIFYAKIANMLVSRNYSKVMSIKIYIFGRFTIIKA